MRGTQKTVTFICYNCPCVDRTNILFAEKMRIASHKGDIFSRKVSQAKKGDIIVPSCQNCAYLTKKSKSLHRFRRSHVQMGTNITPHLDLWSQRLFPGKTRDDIVVSMVHVQTN